MFASRYKILGHSMEPLIKNNSSVLASEIPYIFKNPKINDIVAFKKDNTIFIKRIKEISSNKYFVQGDNIKDSFDSKNFGLISRKQILGKVIFIL